ncbi:MAG: hypothetical protein P4N41_24985 [Negativicutes bacterium]|nr:hypothetical protein [Negativicutes bacterium]
MSLDVEHIIMSIAAAVTLLLFVFAVDWRYFRDWVMVFFLQCALDFAWGSPVVNFKLVEYPVRLLSQWYNTSILFELWVFPVVCILYNQITRGKGLLPVIGYTVIFSALLTAIEYPLELYTGLIKYLKWSPLTTFYTLIIAFLASRTFLAFFRWGCDYFRPVTRR